MSCCLMSLENPFLSVIVLLSTIKRFDKEVVISFSLIFHELMLHHWNLFSQFRALDKTFGDKRSKSFEEREEEYEKARARIFNQDVGILDYLSSMYRKKKRLRFVRFRKEYSIRQFCPAPSRFLAARPMAQRFSSVQVS